MTRLACLIVCAAFLCPSIPAQSFLARQDYDPNGWGGPSSGGLAVFDATGDGIPDLVVAGIAILVFPGKATALLPKRRS